jgi:hypothetical protein
MILPGFVLYQTVNQQLKYSGIDSLSYCIDKAHFKKYPDEVKYQYNSRGYRDQEWPEDLTNAIWCFGDSFTVGMGTPREYTWTYLLQEQLGQRTINVSMDGASNNWIARKTKDLFAQLTPDLVILHWSYLHRRENTVEEANFYINDYLDQEWVKFYNCIKGDSWPLCNHRKEFKLLSESIQHEVWTQHYTADLNRWLSDVDDFHIVVEDEKLRSFCSLNPKDGRLEDFNNTIECIQSVERVKPIGTKIIHSFIPYFYGTTPDDATMLKTVEHLKINNYIHVPLFKKLDLSRDGHHYDRKTAQQFVDSILTLLSQ